MMADCSHQCSRYATIPKDDESIITNTEELFGEQDEKENVEVESKIMTLSFIKETLSSS
jgi:hypothetical protein